MAVNLPESYNRRWKFRFVVNLGNLLFYTAYMFLFVKEVLLDRTRIYDLLGGGIVSKLSVLFHLAFWTVCIFILLFLQTYTRRELIVIGCLLGLFMLSFICSDNYILLDGLLLIVCSKNINFEKCMKYMLYIQSIFIVLIILMSMSGMIGMGLFVRTADGELRYAFGFNHPNTLGILVFQWICQYFFLKRNSREVKKYVLAFIIALIMYRGTDSNTGFLMSVIVILCNFIYEKIVDRVFDWRVLKKIVKVVLVIGLIALTFIIRYYWNNPDKLSEFTLVSRIDLAKKYLTAYGISLFGTAIISGTNVSIPGFPIGYYYLDNTVAWLLVNCGILVTICVVAVYVLFIKKMIKSGEWCVIISVVAYLIYSLTEHTAMMIVFNGLAVGFGMVIYKKAYQKNNEKKDMGTEHE